MKQGQFYEEMRRVEPRASSDRSFGLVFAAAFLILPLVGWLHGNEFRWWSLGVSVIFLVLALARPASLHPLNRVWTRFGMLLGRVMTPVIMGVLFFLVVTPFAIGMRWLSKDPLRIKRDDMATSYWIPREPPGPSPETMSNQF